MSRKFALIAMTLVMLGLASGLCMKTDPTQFATFAQESERQLQSRDGLPNLLQVCDGVYSGGQPDGETGFQSLADLGIKTVISVDGATPNLELAKKFDLRYVHLPHGYDGIEHAHAMKLAKAVQTMDGPIYIHCHHGKHRSPAAAAMACIGLRKISKTQGQQFLVTAGTSQNYHGLYQSVETATAFEWSELDQLDTNFPEIAPTTPLVDAMVKIEQHLGAIEHASKNNWQTDGQHPDISLSHESLLLFEQFVELHRHNESKDQEYLSLLESSKSNANDLHLLFQSAGAASKNMRTLDREKAKELLGLIKNDCRACHRKFRD